MYGIKLAGTPETKKGIMKTNKLETNSNNKTDMYRIVNMTTIKLQLN